MAGRLEHIRQISGQPDLMSFWRHIGGEETGASYASVRRYHYDREASPTYLAAVAEAFPNYRLEWLVAGKQPATWTELVADQTTSLDKDLEQTKREIRIAFAGLLPVERLQPSALAMLNRVWKIASDHYDPGRTWPDPEFAREVAERVAAAIAAPLEALDLPPEKVYPFNFEEYVISASQALTRLFEGASIKRLDDGEA